LKYVIHTASDKTILDVKEKQFKLTRIKQWNSKKSEAPYKSNQLADL